MDVPPEALAGLPSGDIFDTLELAERFGWTPTEAEEQSAAMTDWMLAIARTKDRVKAKAQG